MVLGYFTFGFKFWDDTRLFLSSHTPLNTEPHDARGTASSNKLTLNFYFCSLLSICPSENMKQKIGFTVPFFSA